MAYNGSGTFTRLYNWVTDRTNLIKIRADRMDAEMDGMASGLSNAICKDGQTTLTGDIPFSNRKLTGLGNATLAADALNMQTADGRYFRNANALTASTNLSAADLIPFWESVGAVDKGITWTDFQNDLLGEWRAAGHIFATAGAATVVFRQNTAPTGWTKLTTATDRILRVQSGALADGGTNALSVAFPAQTPTGSISATSLSIAQLAVHGHTTAAAGTSTLDGGGANFVPLFGAGTATSSVGSGTTHGHVFTGNASAGYAPAWTDVIFASKN